MNIESRDLVYSALDEEILLTCQSIKLKAAQVASELPTISMKTILELTKLDEVKKQSILEDLRLQLSWLEEVSIIQEKEKNSTDIEFAKACLRKMKSKASDEFWKTISHGDVIEIYNNEMRQVFRSLSFFKFSEYSLLDLSVYEWYKLYERPKIVTEKMMGAVQMVISLNAKCIDPEIPEHISRQSLASGLTDEFTPVVNKIKFKSLGCIWDKDTNQISGIIVSSAAEHVLSGENANIVGFLN